MFEKTLLDSSIERYPALRPLDGLISLAVGSLGFAAGSLLLPVAAVPGANRILLLRAAVLGAALAVYTLAVCYTYSDARRAGCNRWLWPGVVVLFNLPGFFAYLAYSAMKTGDWKRATVPMAYTLEIFMVGIAALVPLIYTQALPAPIRAIITTAPAPPPGTHTAAQRPPQRWRPEVSTSVLLQPIRIPAHIPDFSHEAALPPAPLIGGIGVPGGMGESHDPILDSILSPNPGPPPRPEPQARPVERVIRQSEYIAARAISTPKPEYPSLALATRTEGTVKLRAVIGRDGTVQELQLISGPALLVRATMAAVARWRYQPTLLNGEPVEVETEIDVNFVLNN